MPVNRRNALRGGALAAASTVFLTRPAFASAATPAAAAAPAARACRPRPRRSSPPTGSCRPASTGRRRSAPRRWPTWAASRRRTTRACPSPAVGPLWTDLPFGPGSDYTTSMYARLRAIAVDWGTPGGALSGDPVVLDRIKAALELIYASQYNENTGEIGNWYTYEIGIPYYVLHTLSVVADQLTADELARYVSPIKRFVGNPNVRTNNDRRIVETGANRADKALISIVSGALIGDTAWIKTGIDAHHRRRGRGRGERRRQAGPRGGRRLPRRRLVHPARHHPVPRALRHRAAHRARRRHPRHRRAPRFALPADAQGQGLRAGRRQFAPFVDARRADGAGPRPDAVAPGRDRARHRPPADRRDARPGPDGAPAKRRPSWTASPPSGSRKARTRRSSKIPDPERFAPGPDLVATPGIEFAQDMLAAGARPARTVRHAPGSSASRTGWCTSTDGWSASLGVGSTRISRYESINGQNLQGWYIGDGVLYTFLPNARATTPTPTGRPWTRCCCRAPPRTTARSTPVRCGAEPVGPNAAHRRRPLGRPARRLRAGLHVRGRHAGRQEVVVLHAAGHRLPRRGDHRRRPVRTCAPRSRTATSARAAAVPAAPTASGSSRPPRERRHACGTTGCTWRTSAVTSLLDDAT